MSLIRSNTIWHGLIAGCTFALLAAINIYMTRHAGHVTVFWPANGTIVAIALLTGRRYWPAQLACTTVANIILQFAAGDPAAFCFGIAIANAAEMAIVVELVGRFGLRREGQDELVRLVLCFGMVVVGTGVGAFIGSLMLMAMFGQPVAPTALRWWFAGAISMEIMLMPALTWRPGLIRWPRPAELKLARILEIAVLLAVFAVAATVVRITHLPIISMFGPPLLWCALRFGTFWTALAGSILAVSVSLLASSGAWPMQYPTGSLAENMLPLQALLMIAALAPVLVATVVEARDLAAARLLLSEQRLAYALDGIGEGLWDWNIATGEVYVSDRWLEILGYARPELPDTVKIWAILGHPIDQPLTLAMLKQHFEGNTEAFEVEQRLRHKDGRWIWVLDRGKVVERDAAGKPLRAVGTHLDITERRLREAELARLATIDSLTKLSNRAALEQRYRELAASKDGKMTLFLLDLDRFKAVNDSHGHGTGDKVLQIVAERLRACTRQGDLIARLGGDEFAIVVEGNDPHRLSTMARRIVEDLRRPIVLDGVEHECGVSIGIASFPAEADQFQPLYELADRRLYEVKRTGGANWASASEQSASGARRDENAA